MPATRNAASACFKRKIYAARLTRSPPRSPVAKSAHEPVRRLILKLPGLASPRVGLSAIHSAPSRLPLGSQRETIDSACARAPRRDARESDGFTCCHRSAIASFKATMSAAPFDGSCLEERTAPTIIRR